MYARARHAEPRLLCPRRHACVRKCPVVVCVRINMYMYLRRRAAAAKNRNFRKRIRAVYARASARTHAVFYITCICTQPVRVYRYGVCVRVE